LACDALATSGKAPASGNYAVLQIPEMLGESSWSKYKGAIDIDSFCLGAAEAVDNGVLTVDKALDTSTPPLLAALQKGTTLPSATLTVVRKSDSTVLSKYEFSDLHVNGYRFGGDDDLREDVLFRWQQVTYTVAGGPQQILDAPKEWGRQSMPVCGAVTSSREVTNPDYDGFLKITGVPGSSVDKTHKQEIDVAGLCFGATNIDGASPRFTSFVMPKATDVSTGPLFTAFGQKAALGATTITLRTISASPIEVLKIAVTGASVEAMVSHGPNAYDDLALGWQGGALTYTNSEGSVPVEITR
jgi:type VI protein secretion system component Hcp